MSATKARSPESSVSLSMSLPKAGMDPGVPSRMRWRSGCYLRSTVNQPRASMKLV